MPFLPLTTNNLGKIAATLAAAKHRSLSLKEA